MENKVKDIGTFCPVNIKEWRDWLAAHHDLKSSVWLVYGKKGSGLPSITWSEAVDEALCFGWIDSIKKPIDRERFMQFFCKRKPNSVWSKINKEKVQRLLAQDLIEKAGLAVIKRAKQNGSWAALDAVETLKIPKDLAAEFKDRKEAKIFFLGLSKSTKKAILQWILMAKKAETRQNRILEFVKSSSENGLPKQFLR
ncbi:YdeI/OmpD-associated family protein [Pedobacter sp. ISL-68]|uniref:YdeI/OmpD-associated family protein n=1 Tax=unclassified Pedobacter TaxID=2628915 RepID=UPI001BE7D310|nr:MULTISPECIES: YdeI/OmpD-associated family protein [unclassified Pedobacter]MBT2563078.1 YdeI/OmpD-associated family protein [Pedobacter sp. ISL-64]MBT2593082.1 YdeI/OmpD-associated family protein [Pedobacter sp. ISL-68]